MIAVPNVPTEIIKGVMFRKIDPVNVDERGRVYRWCTGLQGKEISIFQRQEGVSFGNHYHRGSDPSRNPERFLLLQGMASFWAFNGLTNERVQNVVVEEFTEILVDKGILHGLKAMSDILFIEHRSTTFDQNSQDMYLADTYESYIKEIKNK